MKVLVCGSRHFNDYELLKRTLDAIPEITEIIHGGANGADTLGGRYGREVGIPVTVFPANWDLYGKRAGPIRNYEMLKSEPDGVVAFRAPDSRGTKHMIEIAQKARINTKVVDIT